MSSCASLQVSGRVWLHVSSWSVLWPPCSGSSMTRSRSTSVCPAPLHLRCQNPWRRSLVSPSKAPSRAPPLSCSLIQHFWIPNSHSTCRSFLYLCCPLLLLCRAQGCYYTCIFKNKRARGEDGAVTLGLPKVETIFFSRNTCCIISSLENCWNSN